MNETKNYNKIFLLALLGMLTALAPVINNMFSPAMPSMASAMGCNSELLQLCLTASLVGLALGQLVIGPLSDRMGRRLPLISSMLLYVVASFGILVANSISVVIVLRLLQGLGAGGGIVISRSVATDLSSGNRLLKMLATINVINGLMPIVTPMLGGFLVARVGYNGPFAGMAVIGIILMAGCWMLTETLPAENRITESFGHTMGLFKNVLCNGQFMGTVIHQGGALAALFANIAATPFIIQHYGYGPESIGLALGVNGIFTALGAGLAPSLGNTLRGIRVSAGGMLTVAVMMGVSLWMDMGLWPYEVLVCIMLFMVGITLTSSSTHAMESARQQAGTASAMLGAVGFIVGAVVAPLIGIGDVLRSTAVVYLAAAVLAAVAALPIKPLADK